MGFAEFVVADVQMPGRIKCWLKGSFFCSACKGDQCNTAHQRARRPLSYCCSVDMVSLALHPTTTCFWNSPVPGEFVLVALCCKLPLLLLRLKRSVADFKPSYTLQEATWSKRDIHIKREAWESGGKKSYSPTWLQHKSQLQMSPAVFNTKNWAIKHCYSLSS